MSETVEMKTCELEGVALDWAVATAQGWIRYEEDSVELGWYWHTEPENAPYGPIIYLGDWRPSNNWSQCGPLIEKYDIALVGGERNNQERRRLAHMGDSGSCAYGSDNLIAACRAIVRAKLGETINVPAELIK
ncbi:TPA: DUF2591 domain-containing protein [Pseudomonas aeruginosa]|nr:DUF2591 domain-containing protein [Pseudomonas aeruginosa]